MLGYGCVPHNHFLLATRAIRRKRKIISGNRKRNTLAIGPAFCATEKMTDGIIKASFPVGATESIGICGTLIFLPSQRIISSANNAFCITRISRRYMAPQAFGTKKITGYTLLPRLLARQQRLTAIISPNPANHLLSLCRLPGLCLLRGTLPHHGETLGVLLLGLHRTAEGIFLCDRSDGAGLDMF